MESFDAWFARLCGVAERHGVPFLVNRDDQQSYREYFDDGNTPDECLECEIQAWKECQ